MRLPFRVFLVAILFAMLTGNAEAANATLCVAYVKAAMKRIAINKSLGCGITGIGFVDDEAGQRRWCKQSTDAAVSRESLWDDKVIEKCQILAARMPCKLMKLRVRTVCFIADIKVIHGDPATVT